ncbi:alpha/beta hydrolase [Baekduia sp.]|jgi:pimeloyl-ACP methyl ester carboxylesterase|uniref:alpha/beta fold hydrolase n=1 Tax=Baekduia sp. TaxID=2600305 RepID=UPI002E0C8BE6|nr:alpha/beta hydrolase [Baekduia sp.]
MHEQFADVGNGITLCYETFGDPAAPPVVLIMGLGTQMIAWDTRFCEDLASRGFFVVRFDNRDVGRSTRLDDAHVPGLSEIALRRVPNPAYKLADMALDTVGLMNALELESAHVVGVSMGGMIAQTVAARHPSRTRTLTSIMSNTGARFSGQPALKAYPVLLGKSPADRDGFVERGLKTWATIGSPGFERDEIELRAMIELSFDRGPSAAGTARQLGAIIASGDRRRELRAVQAPTLVIHGEADVLVSPSGGRATAKAINGARLITIPGMGHDLPCAAWPQLLGAIAQHGHGADVAAGVEPAVRAA